MELFGKKLLVLGSNTLMCDIVNTAKRLGVYVIVTDWNKLEVSPAKQIADEYLDVSLMDYDTLSRIVLDRGIDGILTGFADSYMLPYQKLERIMMRRSRSKVKRK